MVARVGQGSRPTKTVGSETEGEMSKGEEAEQFRE
jgi:hypothetical protein